MIMKKLQYLLLALVCGTLTACMDKDWSDPMTENAFGNASINETNVITIKQLKNQYKAYFGTDSAKVYTKIKKATQIKGIVTSNDIEGNVYNEITIQDGTDAIFIEVAQGGMSGILPIGTEILVELEGLYIGNNEKCPCIGVPYTNASGEESVSRMSRHLWQNHFTYTGKTEEVKPDTFSLGSGKGKFDLDADAGRLGVLVGVTFSRGYSFSRRANVPYTENSTYAIDGGNTSWYFNEQPTVQMYNSGYADFAAMKLPQGKVNVTGVFKRYRDQWEVIIRKIDDVKASTYEPVVINPTGTGTKDDPFNVAAALAKCEETGTTATTQEYYATGYVVEVGEYNSTFGNISLVISDTKEGDNQLTVYRAAGPDKAKITDKNFVKKGDKVLVCGQLINFKGNTPEFTQGCYIVSVNAQGGGGTSTVTEVGSADAPKTVAEAIAAINAMETTNTNSEEFWFVKGKVKQVITTDANITQYKNIDYIITDDGNNELKVFRGKYFDGADFTVDNKVTVDKEVIVYGNLQKYVKNDVVTPEITNSKLISIQ